MTKRKSSADKHLDLNFKGNRHPSKLAALSIHNKVGKGQRALVYKTTQAGATTGICAACLDNNDRFLLIGTTRLNADEVMKSSLLYSDRDDLKALVSEDNPHPRMKTLPTALDCPKIKKEVRECIEKLQVPIFFVNCSKCDQRDECEIYQDLINDDDDVEAMGMTRANLTASLRAEERDIYLERVEKEQMSMGSLKMRKIRMNVKTIIRDECHSDEIPERKILTFMNTTSGEVYNFKEMFSPIYAANGTETVEEESVTGDGLEDFGTMGEYRRRKGPFAFLCDLVDRLSDLVAYAPTLETAQRIVARTESQASSRELQKDTVVNPYHIDLDDSAHIGVFAATIDEIHQIIEAIVTGRIKMRLDDIDVLMNAFYVGCAVQLQVLIHRDGGQQFADFVAIDHKGELLYRNFIREMCNRYRKAFFLSATIGDFKYERLFSDGKIKRLLFGKDGDPTKTCERQMVITSPYKMGISLWDRLPEVVDLVRGATIQHGWYNVVVVAMSAREASIIKKALNDAGVMFADVDYYRSKYSLSTTYKIKTPSGTLQPKVAVLVNAAETPRHTMDYAAKDWKDSASKRYTEMCQATFQTIGRVRNGGFSVVYCAGINEETLRNICTWGPGRTVEVDANDQGHVTYDVKCDRERAKPIIKVGKDVDEMLAMGRRHMGLGVKVLTVSDTLGSKPLAPSIGTRGVAHFVKGRPPLVGNPVKFSDLDVKLRPLVLITRGRCFTNGIFIFQMMVSDTGVFLYSLPRMGGSIEGANGRSETTASAQDHKWYAPEHISKECHLLIFDSTEDSDIGRPAGENGENGHISLEGFDTMESDRPRWETDPSIRRSKAEKQIQEALRSIRVTPYPCGMEYVDGVDLLLDCFCRNRNAFACRSDIKMGRTGTG
jgi:hypothetical protein